MYPGHYSSVLRHKTIPNSDKRLLSIESYDANIAGTIACFACPPPLRAERDAAVEGGPLIPRRPYCEAHQQQLVISHKLFVANPKLLVCETSATLDGLLHPALLDGGLSTPPGPLRALSTATDSPQNQFRMAHSELHIA